MEKNVLKLNLTLTFTDDADITEKDRQEIISKIIDTLGHEIMSGGGIAPEDPENGDYITEFIDVRTEDGHGLTYDVANQNTLS